MNTSAALAKYRALPDDDHLLEIHNAPGEILNWVDLVGNDTTPGSTWTCLQSAGCPATQPSYDLAGTCPGTAHCTYGTTHCACEATGTPWLCGFDALLGLFAFFEAPYPY